MKNYYQTSKAIITCMLLSAGQLSAQTFNSGADVAIPDCATEVCSNISVTGVGTIDGTYGLESVTIKINHTWDGDLDIYLVAPDGTRVELSTDNGGPGDNFGSGTANNAGPYTVFDMTAGTNITAGTAPFTATFVPEGNLGDVNNGQNANGTWGVCVTDDACGDTGFINAISLLFSNSPAPPGGGGPANDLCANATTVTCGSATAGTTVGASTTGEPGFCGTSVAAVGVWYYFVGTGDIVTVDLCGAPYDSKLGIYTGSCGAFTCVGGEDDDFTNCGGNDPSVTFTSTLGTDYYFYANGFGGATGTFTINVTCVSPSPPNCATISSPSDGATGLCTTGNTLDWNAPGAGSAPTGYYIYFGTDNPPTNIENGTDLGNVLTYNPGALSASTTYYWQIVPYNGAGNAAGCSIWSFSTGAGSCYLQTTGTVNTCNGTYYDSGGSSASYSNGESSVFTICPDVPGQYSQVTFNSFITEGCCDDLIVYDGPNTGSPVIGTFSGSSLPCIFWSSDAGGCLTFEFTSDGSVTNAGWDATISCAGTPNAGTAGEDCANPVVVAALPYSQNNENTACMGNDYTNASAGSCGTLYESGEDFVYEYTATGTECIEIALSGTSTNSIGFQVYDGCPDVGGTSCVGSAGGASSGNLSGVVTLPSAGTYYIIIDTWAAPSSATYDIDITSFGTGAPNDLPCNSTVLALDVNYNGDNVCSGSTGETAAPGCWTTGTINSVWYSFTAPASGNIIISTTEGTINGTQIEVFSGTCASLTSVACNQDAPTCGTSSYNNSYLTSAAVTPGATYFIRVDGENNSQGTFNIVVADGANGLPYTAQDCQQPNPVCNAVITVGNPGYQAIGNYCDFDASSTSCLSSGERGSAWYVFDIASNGTLEFNIIPNDFTGTVGPETDYDFALWDITGLSNYCPDIVTGTLADIRCNYSADGVTGCWTTPTAPYNTSGGYEPGVAVSAGETYLLVISNFSNSTSGFSIDYFTSPVNYVTAPTSMTWTGAVDTDWFDPENWGSCGIPDCTTDVVISPSSANQPIINAAGAACRDFRIDPGSDLTINSGYTLSVCGDYVNDGTLNAAAGSTVDFVGTGTQNIDGNLVGTSAFASLTVTKTSGTVSLNQIVEIEGNFTTANNTSVFNTNGYEVIVGGDFSNNNGASTFTNVGTTGILQFDGSGAQLYAPGGALTLNDVIMNHSGPGVTINTDMILGTSGTLTLTNGVIITGSNNVIVNNTAASPVGTTTGNTGSYVQGNLRRFISPTGSFDLPVGHATQGYQRANINFTTATSIGYFDVRFDPYSSNPGPLGAAECSSTYDMAALDNGFWTITANANPTSGTYEATLYNTNYTNSAGAAGWTVMRSNGTWGLVNGICQAGGPATVQRTGMSGFSFFGTTQTSSPLPIELVRFTGHNDGAINVLEWETATETDNDFFTVERSTDGIEFIPVATVDGAGTSSNLLYYSTIDPSPIQGVNYYRLKQTDFDGQYTHSETIAIEVKNGNNSINIGLFPNPTFNNVNVILNLQKEQEISVELLDVAGKIVFKHQFITQLGENNFIIPMELLSKGIYTLMVKDANSGILETKKVIRK